MTAFSDQVRETVSPHKFGGSRRAAALWLASLDSCWDESTGDVEWDVWVARFGRNLLFTDDQGFVWSESFDSEREACRAFERFADDYANWAGDFAHAWVCTDCYFAHHYGATEHEGQWFAGESDMPCDREPLALLDGFDLADYTDSETGEGQQEFSWSSCDGCGTSLGGSRHRLAIFEAK